MSNWADDLATFGQTAELLALLELADDPQLNAKAQKLFYMALSSGWFTAFACCGSCVGCVAYAANMKYRYLLLQYTIERQNAGPNLFSEINLC